MANCDPFTGICDEAPPADDGMMMEEDMDMEEMWEPNDDEKMWMFEANMAMLMMAGEIAFMSIMDLTSWRWANVAELTYSDGSTEDIPWDFENEWWLLQDCASAPLNSCAPLTQLLALLRRAESCCPCA